MVTIGDAMVTLLTDNWAGAGDAPTFGHLVDQPKDLAETTEQVIVRLPIFDDADPFNDILSNFKYIIQIRVKSTVSDDRLKVLADETIRIINTYAITGMSRQFAKRGEDTSDRKRQIFSRDIWTWLEEYASAGGTAYSSPGAGDVTMPADLTVTGDLTAANIITAGDVDGVDISAHATNNDAHHAQTHTHDTDTLEHDGVDSDGGAFAFDTTGAVSFNQDINLVAGNKLVLEGGNTYIGSSVANRMELYVDGVEVERKFSTSLYHLMCYRPTPTNTIDVGHASYRYKDLHLSGDLAGPTDSISIAEVADLLMWGSANAAWVSCIQSGVTTTVGVRQYISGDSYTNMDGTNYHSQWELPLPTNKGGLSLHLAQARVVLNDADDAAYIDHLYVKGLKSDGSIAAIYDDGTNRTTQGTHTYDFGGDVDVTLREKIHVRLMHEVDAVGELDIGGVFLECYYDT